MNANFARGPSGEPRAAARLTVRAAAAKLSSAVVGGIAAKLGNVAPQE